MGFGHEPHSPLAHPMLCVGDGDLLMARAWLLLGASQQVGGWSHVHFSSELIIHFPHENNVVF